MKMASTSFRATPAGIQPTEFVGLLNNGTRCRLPAKELPSHEQRVARLSLDGRAFIV